MNRSQSLVLLLVCFSAVAPARSQLLLRGVPLTGLSGWLHWRSTNRSTAPGACPPAGFDSMPDFDLNAWAKAPWFVQKQLPLSYQPQNQLFCVRAQYTLIDPSKPEAGVVVRNYANSDKVNGPSFGTSGSGNDVMADTRLIAVPDPSATGSTAASKLLVGPERFKQLLPGQAWTRAFGPYWVVAAGVSANKSLGYDWGIVSGGAPDVKTDTGCRAGRPGPTEQQYFGGLWLFSRKPVDSAGTQQMLGVATKLGLDIKDLLDVKQEGCTYQGA